LEDRPKTVTDEYGLTHIEGAEPTENVTTWVFEEGSFHPAAKLADDKQYSILTDYLGTPVQMYDEKGEKTWEMELDIYGKGHTFAGRSLSDCPFRYQGQYEDSETGLYYNRFRYYDPDSGNYISQDPIGLTGGHKLYNYVHDVNSWIDEFGLNRNGHLAGSIHPVTGVPFDSNGFPDFSSYLYPDGANDVIINPTNNRNLDFNAANLAGGYDETPEGYTWHHHQDRGRMQLVETDAHAKTGHTGGFSIHKCG
jgi:RHS repeat-associated protein